MPGHGEQLGQYITRRVGAGVELGRGDGIGVFFGVLLGLIGGGLILAFQRGELFAIQFVGIHGLGGDVEFAT